jgi:hypothetical protein
MKKQDFLEFCFAYGTQALTLAWSKILFISLPVAFYLTFTEKEVLALNALFFFYIADSLLGIVVAIKDRLFSWSKLPRLGYKLLVFYVFLKTSQLVGELFQGFGFEIGSTLMMIILLLFVVLEAKSAVLKANELYPNPVTKPLVTLLNKISKNAMQTLNNEKTEPRRI